MKYVLLIFLLLIISGLFIKFCTGDTYSKDFKNAVEHQACTFTVDHRKGDTAWQRAEVFLHNMKHLYSGGRLCKNDSVMYIPYIPGLGFNKGDSIAISRSVTAGDVRFTIAWFTYDRPDSFGAKEIAYFMNTGIDRYSNK